MKPILAAFLFLVVPASAGELLFSQMKDGDKVEVTEKSIGFFHNVVSYYEVARDSGVYSFAILNITWSEAGPPHQIVKREEVGKMQLSTDDVRRLDGMLDFCRGAKTTGSTTEHSLVLELKQADGVVKTEKIHDDSGGPDTDKEKQNAATFDEMRLRLIEKLQAEAMRASDEEVPPLATAEENAESDKLRFPIPAEDRKGTGVRILAGKPGKDTMTVTFLNDSGAAVYVAGTGLDFPAYVQEIPHSNEWVRNPHRVVCGTGSFLLTVAAGEGFRFEAVLPEEATRFRVKMAYAGEKTADGERNYTEILTEPVGIELHHRAPAGPPVDIRKLDIPEINLPEP
ncbi:MAG: hypothetical protein EOP88_02800 [Verrucomicrobiaceae bacterium]|nr:MAG: hypothetical protein EOP88_02800 [Verrucomicrobiaceae bacterium]